MSQQEAQFSRRESVKLMDMLLLPERQPVTVGGIFQHVIRVFTWFVVTFVWFFVGFALWVPFLVRSIASYSCVVISTSFGYGNLQSAQHGLEFAMHFWKRGFEHANSILSSTPSNYEHDVRGENPFNWQHMGLVLGNLLFTIAFWVLVKFALLVAINGWAEAVSSTTIIIVNLVSSLSATK